MKYTKYLVDAVGLALQAGEAILDVYGSDFEVQTKSDNSPLTLADQKSHGIIKSGLSRHGIAVLSEEGRDMPYKERKQWDAIWIVDPLDGTKEFVKRNGEFTVNIALIEQQYPVLGIVYAPVPDVLYFGSIEIGAYKMVGGSRLRNRQGDKKSWDARLDALIQMSQKLPSHSSAQRDYTIVGSRSHGTAELEAFVAHKREERGGVAFIQAGSSLKICLVAEGAADIYPRLGPTMEWDTAAGQAVAEIAGARVYQYDGGHPLTYNREDQLNPWFVVEREPEQDPPC
jgi:3'(2'), 5'-bisphosphate nucleotidase